MEAGLPTPPVTSTNNSISQGGFAMTEITRRSAVVLSAAAALPALAVGTQAHAAAEGGIKVTVLYNEPKNPEALEKYYAETHMPMVYAVKELKRVEISKCLPGADKPPAFYRIAELWFDSPEQMKAITSTDEWKKIADDVPNFASAGATIVVSKIG